MKDSLVAQFKDFLRNAYELPNNVIDVSIYTDDYAELTLVINKNDYTIGIHPDHIEVLCSGDLIFGDCLWSAVDEIESLKLPIVTIHRCSGFFKHSFYVKSNI